VKCFSCVSSVSDVSVTIKSEDVANQKLAVTSLPGKAPPAGEANDPKISPSDSHQPQPGEEGPAVPGKEPANSLQSPAVDSKQQVAAVSQPLSVLPLKLPSVKIPLSRCDALVGPAGIKAFSQIHPQPVSKIYCLA